MLTEREQRRILKGRNVAALIGAGIAGYLDAPLDEALLQRAAQISPTNPVVWAALGYRSFSLIANGLTNGGSMEATCQNAVDQWQKLAPENAAPRYLAAALAARQSNLAVAKQLLRVASQMDTFDSCEGPLNRCVVVALESAGRSRFTARLVGSGNVSGLVAWHKLSQSILDSAPSREEIQGCLQLGSQLARDNSIATQMLGWAIQKQGWAKIAEPTTPAELARIAAARQHVRLANDYLESHRTRIVTEAQWIDYFDRSFIVGEMTAIQELAAQLGDTFSYACRPANDSGRMFPHGSSASSPAGRKPTVRPESVHFPIGLQFRNPLPNRRIGPAAGFLFFHAPAPLARRPHQPAQYHRHLGG